MREFNVGDDLTDLVELVIKNDKDGDSDFYVTLRIKQPYEFDGQRHGDDDPDELVLSSFYLRHGRLDGMVAAREEAKVAEAIKSGGIDSIEAFLEA